MFRNFAFLFLAVVLVAGCGTTSGKSGKGHGNGKLFLIQEDMPAEQQSLASGRDVLNKLVHFGKKEEEVEAGPVVISSFAETVEKAVAADMGGATKSYSFKGEKKPANIRAWLAEQGVKDGKAVDSVVKGWGVKAYPKDRYNYIVYVNTETTVTDLRSGKVVGKYSCSSDTSSVPAEKGPTKYELLKADKALIKKLYRERSNDCAARTVKNL